ncbi:MAG: DsbA family oxidoreductase, partial [Longimicrobiales bacterium]
CYLAEAVIAPLRADGVRIDARAFELRPAPMPLPSMEKPYYRTSWERGVLPLAERLGVHGMRRPVFATRTRKAHEAVCFAREHDADDALRHALYEAYFVEQRDIGRIDVLVGIGAAVALEPLALKVALDVDKYTGQVVAQEAEAQRLGVTVVPAQLVPGADGVGRIMMGVRTTDELRALLAAGNSARIHGEDE